MLVFTRRPGERVFIGDDICVAILDVRGNQVRVGFEAPLNVVIDREEVYLRKHPEGPQSDKR